MTRTTLFTRRARAASNPGSRDAVTFNKTLLTNPGSIANMPASASEFLLAFNYRSTTVPTTQIGRTVIVFNAGIPAPSSVQFLTDGLGHTLLQLGMNNTSGSAFFRAWTPPLPFDGVWRSIVASMDSMQGLCTLSLDGNSLPMTIQIGSTPQAVNFAAETYIGSDGMAGKTVYNPYVGDLADLTLYAGQGYLDAGDSNVVGNFYDYDNELPKRIGPTGWATLDEFNNRRPQICLSGPASQFMQNLTAGEFEPMGGVPGYHDTTPTSMFTLVAGNLVNAASDPWSDPA